MVIGNDRECVHFQMEAETGVQCYMHYIFDLEGLHFDPTLLGVVNGKSLLIILFVLISQYFRKQALSVSPGS